MQTPLTDAITNLCRVAWNTAKLDIGELVLSPEQSEQLTHETIGETPFCELIIDDELKERIMTEPVSVRTTRFVNPITGTTIKITVSG